MTRFSGMTRARLAGLLAVVPAVVFTAGYFAVGSQAVPAIPAPTITQHLSPSDSSPEVTFTDVSWPDVTFTCWLDFGPRRSCTAADGHRGGATVEGTWQSGQLPPGYHCLFVLAAGRGGSRSAVTRFCWTIAATRDFRVGGDLPAPLYPGTSQSLNLTFTNPNPAPITISRGGISARNITISTSTSGCASSNFAVAQGLTGAVTIPARQGRPTSLSALGVLKAKWPVIEMVDASTNQDACQGAKLTLTFAGIEAAG